MESKNIKSALKGSPLKNNLNSKSVKKTSNKLKAAGMLLLSLIIGSVYQKGGFSWISFDGNINIKEVQTEVKEEVKEEEKNQEEKNQDEKKPANIEFALNLAYSLKSDIAEFQANYEKCPQNFEDLKLDSNKFRNINIVKEMSLVSETENCNLNVKLRPVNDRTKVLENKEFDYYIDMEKTEKLSVYIWKCKSESLMRSLPSDCKSI